MTATSKADASAALRRAAPIDGDAGRDGLDALRGVAALAVLLVHVYQVFLLRGVELRWLRAGDAGVTVFFVLSGYLIAASVLRPRRFARRSYALHRAARILPLYLASIAITVLLVDAAPLLTRDGQVDLLAHVTMVHGLFESTRYSINGVWWTLTVECLFYALVAVAAPILRHRRGGVAMGVVLVATGVGWRAAVASSDPERTSYLVQQLPGMADLFGVGILVAVALAHPRPAAIARRPAVRWSIGGSAVALLAVALWSYHQRQPLYWSTTRFLTLWPTAMAVGVAGVIVGLRSGGGTIDRVVRRTGLAYLGRISYGTYLLHPFVLGALARAWWKTTPTVPVVPFVVLATTGTVAVAAFFHRQLELPAMAWARARTGRRPDSTAAAAPAPARFRPMHADPPSRPRDEALGPAS